MADVKDKITPTSVVISTDLGTKIIPAIILISVVGLICNAVSFAYFIKRNRELGNALLAYMNIVDMIVSLAVFMYMIAYKIHNFVITKVLTTLSNHAFRCTLIVTGVLTIYLNILRTSAIVWPMVRFKRRLVMASLIALIIILVGVETTIGVLFTYPNSIYFYKLSTGAKASPPFTGNEPLVKFIYWELQVFGIPIVLVVTVCCIVSAVKLLLPNKILHETEASGARINAAVTVLILGVQYMVWNTISLTLGSMWVYYTKRNLPGKFSVVCRLGAHHQLRCKPDCVYL